MALSVRLWSKTQASSRRPRQFVCHHAVRLARVVHAHIQPSIVSSKSSTFVADRVLKTLRCVYVWERSHCSDMLTKSSLQGLSPVGKSNLDRCCFTPRVCVSGSSDSPEHKPWAFLRTSKPEQKDILCLDYCMQDVLSARFPRVIRPERRDATSTLTNNFLSSQS